MRRPPAWVKEWGPTIAVVILLGPVAGSLWRASVFAWSGERRLGAVETDIASIKRLLYDQCTVNYGLLWWMQYRSAIDGQPGPPDHLNLLRDGCAGRKLASEREAAPFVVAPGWLDAYAGEYQRADPGRLPVP